MLSSCYHHLVIPTDTLRHFVMPSSCDFDRHIVVPSSVIHAYQNDVLMHARNATFNTTCMHDARHTVDGEHRLYPLSTPSQTKILER